MRKFGYFMAVVCFVSGILLNTSCDKAAETNEDLTQFVDPFIGTSGHGHVFLGASVPFGMVQLGPTQYKRGWDWCSGYHYSDSVIIGFGHQHLSGTGIGDLGDVALLPVADTAQTEMMFSHDNEQCRPGYYSVVGNNGIKVELTATARAGYHRYTFPDSIKTPMVRLDLVQGIGWDAMTSCKINVVDDNNVTGFRMSEGWAKDQRIYFAAEFSAPIKTAKMEGDSIAVFSVSGAKELIVKVGISAVSIDNAKENMTFELTGKTFEDAVKGAKTMWNSQLSKVRIETKNEADKRIFYTSLYHTMFAPSLFCDVNGEYRGADGKTYKSNLKNYSIFSLWDTYRAAHPLYTLIQPEMQSDIANTFINIYKQQGRLPVWHLAGNETDCMIGNPGIPVLTDIYLKGYNVQRERVFEAVKATAMDKGRSLDLLQEYGYIPYDKDSTNETVAKGLEYALADACVAKVAKRLGKDDDYKYFYERSMSYKKYFDPETKFMRALSSDGKFREPFDPFASKHRADDYTEGNAWQYLWLVPHDVEGLVELMGGKEKFVEKLDSLFILDGNMGAEASPDITGLIGQYAHGNEPEHHVIYLYDYVDQPEKAARLARQVMTTLYTDKPDGLCGNEDVGQMSSWYVLSSMGLYQVEPAGGRYMFGSPLFDKVEMKVKGGTFTIIAHDNSRENMVVDHVLLNGKAYDKNYIDFKDIANGGKLEFFMKK